MKLSILQKISQTFASLFHIVRIEIILKESSCNSESVQIVIIITLFCGGWAVAIDPGKLFIACYLHQLITFTRQALFYVNSALNSVISYFRSSKNVGFGISENRFTINFIMDSLYKRNILNGKFWERLHDYEFWKVLEFLEAEHYSRAES